MPIPRERIYIYRELILWWDKNHFWKKKKEKKNRDNNQFIFLLSPPRLIPGNENLEKLIILKMIVSYTAPPILLIPHLNSL